MNVADRSPLRYAFGLRRSLIVSSPVTRGLPALGFACQCAFGTVSLFLSVDPCQHASGLVFRFALPGFPLIYIHDACLNQYS